MKELKRILETSRSTDGPVWLDLAMDPVELVEQEKWDDLIVYSEENMELLTRKVLSGFNDSLAESLMAGAICLDIVETLLKAGSVMAYALFTIGKLKGALNILDRKLSYDSERRETEIIAEKHLSGIKHLDDIILMLKQNETLTHSSLAEQMGNMNPPTLTENIKKISQYGLIYSKKIGKYKYYHLTDAGLRYAESVKKRRGNSADLEYIQKTLQELLNGDNTKGQTMDMLKQLASFQNEDLNDKKDSSYISMDSDVVDYFEKEREKEAFTLTLMDNNGTINGMDGKQKEGIFRKTPLPGLYSASMASSKKLEAVYDLSDKSIRLVIPAEDTRIAQGVFMSQRRSMDFLNKSSKKRKSQMIKNTDYYDDRMFAFY